MNQHISISIIDLLQMCNVYLDANLQIMYMNTLVRL